MTKFAHPKATIIERANETGVLCRCDVFTAFDSYCIAQMAMGHSLNRTCTCGLHLPVAGHTRGYKVSGSIQRKAA